MATIIIWIGLAAISHQYSTAGFSPVISFHGVPSRVCWSLRLITVAQNTEIQFSVGQCLSEQPSDQRVGFVQCPVSLPPT